MCSVTPILVAESMRLVSSQPLSYTKVLQSKLFACCRLLTWVHGISLHGCLLAVSYWDWWFATMYIHTCACASNCDGTCVNTHSLSQVIGKKSSSSTYHQTSCHRHMVVQDVSQILAVRTMWVTIISLCSYKYKLEGAVTCFSFYHFSPKFFCGKNFGLLRKLAKY